MYDLKIDIIKECDGGFTQPSAVSGIRQDLFKIKKIEEATIDKDSQDAGSQFRDLVEKTQDEINDYIEISGWENIPSKVQIVIKQFQNEFDKVMDEYSTPPRELPLYKLWKMLSEEEQDILLNQIDKIDDLLSKGYITKNNFRKTLDKI